MKATGVMLVLAAACAVAISGCGRKYTAWAALHVAYQPETDYFDADSAKVQKEEADIYIRKQMELLVSKSVLTAALRKSEVAALPSVRRQAERGDAVEWLGGTLDVDRPGKSELLVVSCRMNDLHEAVVLTNAVVDAYMAEVKEADRKLQERFDDVDSRATKLEKELDEKLQALTKIAAASLAGKAKAPSTPGPQDAASLRKAVDSIERALRPLTDERKAIVVEIRHRGRITVVERAQEPVAASRPSL